VSLAFFWCFSPSQNARKINATAATGPIAAPAIQVLFRDGVGEGVVTLVGVDFTLVVRKLVKMDWLDVGLEVRTGHGSDDG